MALVNQDLLFYIPLMNFIDGDFPPTHIPTIFPSLASLSVDEHKWVDFNSNFDKVHRHVCGHDYFTDWIFYLFVTIYGVSVLHSMSLMFKNVSQDAPPLPHHSHPGRYHFTHSRAIPARLFALITSIFTISVYFTSWIRCLDTHLAILLTIYPYG